MDIKFNWRRIPILRRGARSPKFDESTVIFHKSQVTFEEHSVKEILAEIGLDHGERAYCVIDVDDTVHAVGFLFLKTNFPKSITFSPTDGHKGKSKQYRITTNALYKHSDIWARVQKLGRNSFSLMRVTSIDPEFRDSTMFVAILQ